MSKLIIILTIVLVVALAFILLTGCNQRVTIDEAPISLVAVTSIRENSNASPRSFSVNAPESNLTLLQLAGIPGSQIMRVTTSGTPIFYGDRIAIPQSTALDRAQLESDMRRNTQNVAGSIMSTVANAPEADLLGAITTAASWLRTQPAEMPRYILVVDSGISTAGLLDFADSSLLLANPEKVVDELVSRGALPNLTGITLIWSGMGDTAGNQLSPGQFAQRSLETLWETIIKRAGGTAVIVPGRHQAVENSSPHPVTVITLPPCPPISFAPESFESNASVFSSPISLDEEQVGFKPDTDEFIDRNRAAEVITPIARHLNDNPTLELLLAGTVAGDSADDFAAQAGMRLSRKRAMAVKEILVALGVSENQVTVIGTGNQSRFHIPGLGVGSEASVNRRVILM